MTSSTTTATTASQRITPAQASLMRALKFKEADLEANRKGTLSDAQMEMFKPPEFKPIVFMVIFGHAGAIFAVLALLAIVTGKMVLFLVAALVGVLGLVPFVLLNNEGNLRPTLTSDVKSGKVKHIRGMVFTEMKKGRVVYYELRVKDLVFRIPSRALAGFRQGEEYDIYYLPLSLTLLSAELVE